MAFDIAPPKRDMPRVTTRRFDRDDVFRLCGWGGSAVVAAGALVLATQADIGKRFDTLTGATPQPAVVAQLPPRPPEKDPETLRLQAEVRSLTADRERLAARFAALEHQLEDLTGSIKRQATPAPAASPAVALAPPPKVAAVQSAPPAPAAAAAPAIPTIDPLAMPLVTGSLGGWPISTAPEPQDQPEVSAEAEVPAQAPKLEMREIPPAPRPLASLTQEPVAPREPGPVARVEYGIDLGGARNMAALRERWAAIKANLGPLMTGLQPIAVRDRKPGSTDLRLVVGPMPNLAAARQVCSRFAAARVTCHAAKFDGEAIVQR